MLELVIAAWLSTATIRALPGEPPLVLAVGRTIPADTQWPFLARTVACRAYGGEVLTYLLVWMPSEYGSPLPAAFYSETVSCPDDVDGRPRGPIPARYE
jgi:hypothetical protein